MINSSNGTQGNREAPDSFMTIAEAHDPETVATNRKALEFLSRQSKPLFALLDTARDNEILPLLAESGCDYVCLYGGTFAETMSDYAPYLVAVPAESPFLRTLLDLGWGESWGIYLTTAVELNVLRRHLRRFLSVKLPDGRQVLFRFYDPRVLRTFLPTCTSEELQRFFGPISAFYLESGTGDAVLSYGLTAATGGDGANEPAKLLQLSWKLG
ncbi:MAG: DUF4123 domain-containing protein [Desulfuromonadales bacterium]|nr:MAG: DUF4123 domain-containing protein [Desulfuromonadales bacterium]